VIRVTVHNNQSESHILTSFEPVKKESKNVMPFKRQIAENHQIQSSSLEDVAKENPEANSGIK
jgi:hypothetical protein